MPAAATALPARLPSISAVDRADSALGSLMSDLDGFAREARSFVEGDGLALKDAVFMSTVGIEIPEEPRYTDPATVARLLVFADNVLDSLGAIEKDAQTLRRQVLDAYLYFVQEPSGRARA